MAPAPGALAMPAAAVAAEMTPGAAADCLPGNWVAKEQGRTRTLTFRADHTGEEVWAAGRTRPFLWRQGGTDRVRLCYPGETDELKTGPELGVDCAARVVFHDGVRYTRTE
jgi:hypothetical protein